MLQNWQRHNVAHVCARAVGQRNLYFLGTTHRKKFISFKIYKQKHGYDSCSLFFLILCQLSRAHTIWNILRSMEILSWEMVNVDLRNRIVTRMEATNPSSVTRTGQSQFISSLPDWSGKRTAKIKSILTVSWTGSIQPIVKKMIEYHNLPTFFMSQRLYLPKTDWRVLRAT